MKPVLILQNLSADGPCHLAAWLQRAGRPFQVFDTESGDEYPALIDGYGALAVLGGEMSANDDLPALRQAERLIVQAMAANVPVVGHCLGGQLMARALGAVVSASPQPEIGWQTITVADDPIARDWLGTVPQLEVFHWHVDTFALPPGASLLASSAACPNQAFAIGPHLAMQFHIELDAAKLAGWAASASPAFLRLQQAHPATVQSGARMLDRSVAALPAQQALAEKLYRRWSMSAV